MTRTVLTGVSGANPLGFLASLGLLRLLRHRTAAARMGFTADGAYHPFVDRVDGDLSAIVASHAIESTGKQPWRLEYEKEEKRGTKTVADLKAPPRRFAEFVVASVERWRDGDGDAAAFAAAFGTTVAKDGKGNTKPTALHFTAANQQFLDTIEKTRAMVTVEWVRASVFEGSARRPGSNLRWDPAAERNWALMANNPNDEGTSVDAPLEWLAFQGLPVLPTFPRGERIITTAVSGRGDEMTMTWPLWSVPASLETVRSALLLSWTGAAVERTRRGIFAVCTSAIRRTSQGFGNFGPATVAP
ncbi:MAG TPA: hypothetical protein VHT91_25535 [Kofleriaceae bacterium]|jgi:hypothetical protein|nr:hypothetical protein [Kofleriaceae bacterium]